jgi:acyl-CoA synthetase
MGRVPAELVERYQAAGLWGTDTLTDVIRRNAAANPDGLAFLEGEEKMTWREYQHRSNRIAGALIEAGFQPGERIAVILPNCPTLQVVHVGVEKAGMTVVGLGVRAGEREVRHLIEKGEAVGLITEEAIRGRPSAPLYQMLVEAGRPMRGHFVLPGFEDRAPSAGAYDAVIEERRLGPNDLYLLNSTSGTTGLPKIVMQFQNRWFAYHQIALDAGGFTADDVILSLAVAPYGFSQWTAKFTPALLGAPCIEQARFATEGVLGLIERHRATVLMCVSSQFVMLLNSPDIKRRDLSSLRCMFTGGEAIPYDRAAEFEEVTGARVLQFYGSNETGALSYTTMRDGRDKRLTTAGRIIPWMNVRLLDDDGVDIRGRGLPGQPACKGPVTCLGYLGGAEANKDLFTPDGWMLTGDIAVIDEDDCLTVVGRKGDFIIRGGKNIGAPEVEEDVGSHPAVALCAAVAMPDPLYGERVCCYIVLRPGLTLSLDQLRKHLAKRGASIESWPERLIFVDSLPTASGAKIAKGELRADIRRRLAEEKESSSLAGS